MNDAPVYLPTPCALAKFITYYTNSNTAPAGTVMFFDIDESTTQLRAVGFNAPDRPVTPNDILDVARESFAGCGRVALVPKEWARDTMTLDILSILKHPSLDNRCLDILAIDFDNKTWTSVFEDSIEFHAVDDCKCEIEGI